MEGKAKGKVKAMPLYLPVELHRRLKVTAARLDTSCTRIVREALVSWLNKADAYLARQEQEQGEGDKEN